MDNTEHYRIWVEEKSGATFYLTVKVPRRTAVKLARLMAERLIWSSVTVVELWKGEQFISAIPSSEWAPVTISASGVPPEIEAS